MESERMMSNSGINLMLKRGGSFVKAIAHAWNVADDINKTKLEQKFSYFREYETKRMFIDFKELPKDKMVEVIEGLGTSIIYVFSFGDVIALVDRDILVKELRNQKREFEKIMRKMPLAQIE